MQVKIIAECSKGSILQYFRPALSYHMALRSLFCLFLSGRLRQVSLNIFVYLQRSVVNSKQFPFRFFSAYEVLEQLKIDFETTRKCLRHTKLAIHWVQTEQPKLTVKILVAVASRVTLIAVKLQSFYLEDLWDQGFYSDKLFEF